MNNFYTSVFNKKTEETGTTLPMRTQQKMLDIQISEEMVLKAIRKLKTNKSPGPDGLHPRVIKEIAENIAPALTMIFRKSLETGQLPED